MESGGTSQASQRQAGGSMSAQTNAAVAAVGSAFGSTAVLPQVTNLIISVIVAALQSILLQGQAGQAGGVGLGVSASVGGVVAGIS